MTELNYPARIRELYEGEIFGEASSLAILEVAKTERDRYHIGTLLQRNSISLSEKMGLGAVPEIVSGYQGSDWQTFTASIRKGSNRGFDSTKEARTAVRRTKTAVRPLFPLFPYFQNPDRPHGQLRNTLTAIAPCSD